MVRRGSEDPSHEACAFRFGFGRADITVFERGMLMWGWASSENVAMDVAAPLFARALVLTAGPQGKPLVFVCLDLGMISESLRRSVLAELLRAGVDVDEHRLTLTATHTHSGPSGFSTYLFYAMGGPGVSLRVHDRIVQGVVEAVLEATSRIARGRVFTHAGDIPLTQAVSFNQSIAAYNRNPDVNPLPADRADEAVHRRMTVLRFEDEEGRPRGLVSFFAVHGTSIHSDNTLLHPDNKGLAARMCESETDVPSDFVALFAQESAGDVSPNYRPSPSRGMNIGRYDDDFQSVEHNAGIQASHAMGLFRSAPREGRELAATLSARLRYSAFHEVAVDPDLAGGASGVRTAKACLGLGFCLGTLEGPGPLNGVRTATRRFAGLLDRITAGRAQGEHEHARAHGRKVRIWDLGPGHSNRIGRIFAPDHPLLVIVRDRRMYYYRRAVTFRGARTLPWIPHNLPVQLVTIGDLALAFVPFEPTTQSGRRLRALVTRELAITGVRETIVAGYSNAYASYLTTPEEYDEQDYEGGVTLFGRASLGALGTEIRRVARALLEDAPLSEIGDPPPSVPIEEWIPCEPSAEKPRVEVPIARSRISGIARKVSSVTALKEVTR